MRSAADSRRSSKAAAPRVRLDRSQNLSEFWREGAKLSSEEIAARIGFRAAPHGPARRRTRRVVAGKPVPESQLEATEQGLIAKEDGWFVLNARDADQEDFSCSPALRTAAVSAPQAHGHDSTPLVHPSLCQLALSAGVGGCPRLSWVPGLELL